VNDGSSYGKYIITEMKTQVDEAAWTTNPIRAAANGQDGRVLWLDNDVLPGSFYVETVWAYPPEGGEPADKYPQHIVDAHIHDFDEVLCFFGTDKQDPHNLNAEVEFWLGEEEHIITKSAIVFIPKGLSHGPLVYRKVDKPMFVFSSGSGALYG
jgi:hypothetical protein